MKSRAARRTPSALGTLTSLALAFLAASLFTPITTGAEPTSDGDAQANDWLALSPPGSQRAPALAPPDGRSLVGSVAILGGVLLAIAVALGMARRFIPGLAPTRGAGAIEVIGQRVLGTKSAIYLVRCGPRVLIVGATPHQLTALAEIADPDEIAQIVRSGQSNESVRSRRSVGDATGGGVIPELKGQVDGILERIQSWKTSG